MRGFRGGIGLVFAALASASLSVAVSQPAVVVDATPRLARRPVKRSYLATAPVKYRNRWKPAKPKRRPNRLHISRRTRRRHRRAR